MQNILNALTLITLRNIRSKMFDWYILFIMAIKTVLKNRFYLKTIWKIMFASWWISVDVFCQIFTLTIEMDDFYAVLMWWEKLFFVSNITPFIVLKMLHLINRFYNNNNSWKSSWIFFIKEKCQTHASNKNIN